MSALKLQPLHPFPLTPLTGSVTKNRELPYVFAPLMVFFFCRALLAERTATLRIVTCWSRVNTMLGIGLISVRVMVTYVFLLSGAKTK
jgi:hypothetical protein